MKSVAPGKFVWPPKPVEVLADREGPRPGDAGRGPGGASVRTWAPAVARSGWRAVVSEVERVWLDRTRGPLAERMAQAAWRPDERTAYCPRCASSAGPHEADDTGCSWCSGRDLPWSRAVRLGDYRGLLRELILEVKFTRWRRLGTDLGRLLGRALMEEIEAVGIDPARVALTPVPMSFRRWMMTGIDHTLVICRGVARETGLPIVRALGRRHGRSQVVVGGNERATNVHGAIHHRKGLATAWREGGWVVVVVDDVRTTGATLTAACRAINRGFAADAREGLGIAIWSAVAGVTPRERGG